MSNRNSTGIYRKWNRLRSLLTFLYWIFDRCITYAWEETKRKGRNIRLFLTWNFRFIFNIIKIGNANNTTFASRCIHSLCTYIYGFPPLTWHYFIQYMWAIEMNFDYMRSKWSKSCYGRYFQVLLLVHCIIWRLNCPQSTFKTIKSITFINHIRFKFFE